MSREGQSKGKVNEDLAALIQKILGERPIAYYPAVARALGSVNGAIFLSQLLYWLPRSKEGWVYKTQDEWNQETALTRREQETARGALRAAKVLLERRAGVPARLFYSVDYQHLASLMVGYQPPVPPAITAEDADDDPAPTPASRLEKGGVQPRMAESAKLDWRNSPDKNGGLRQTLKGTEITTKNTTDIVGVVTRKRKYNFSTATHVPPEGSTPILALPLEGVAHDLHTFGLSPETALELADTYPVEHILTKLDFVRWLIDERRPPENPPGFLRRAIEDDYAPPPTYRTPQQRQVETDRHAQAEEDERAARQEAEAAYRQAKELARQRLAAATPALPIPGSDLTTEAAWEQVLGALREGLTGPVFLTYFKGTRMVSCDETSAVVVALNRYVAEIIVTRYMQRTEHALRQVLHRAIRCMVVPLDEVAGDAGEDDTQGRFYAAD